MKNTFNLKGIIILGIVIVVFDIFVAFALARPVTNLVQKSLHKTIDNKINIHNIRFHPILLSITASDVEVFDDDNDQARIFLANKLSARLSIISLLSKKIALANLDMDGVELEVVKDNQGQLNIENFSKNEPVDDSRMQMLKKWWQSGRKDWFSNIYERLKPKKDSDKSTKEPTTKITKEVTDLPKGKIIHYKSPFKSSFKIGSIKLTNGKLILNDRGSKLPPFEDININVRNFNINPNGSSSFDHISISGTQSSDRKGNFKILVKSRNGLTKATANLKQMNMAILKPLYEDSLPIVFEKGYLDLDSESTLRIDELSSQNAFKIYEYQLSPRNQWSLQGVSIMSIIEVLNKRQSLEMAFEVVGTPDKPHFKGFQDSLMKIIGEELKNTSMGELKEKANKAFSGVKDKFKELF